MCNINEDHIMYGSWDVKHHNFLVILGHVLSIYPTKTPKIQNFEKIKQTPGDIIILHKCTINHDHMLYCSWDMIRDGCNFYFFILCYFFALLHLQRSEKSWKILKKWKKFLEIWCMVPEIWCITDRWADGKTDIQRWVPHLKITME